MRGKAVGILLGTIVLLGTGLAMASKSKPKIKPKSTDDEDLEVVMPNAQGEPGKGGSIVMDEYTANAEAEGPPKNIDERLEVLAADEGKSKDDAIKEVVDTVTKGVEAPPLAVEEITEKFDPKGSVKLARLLLVREELPNWKKDTLDGDVGEWQELVGLKKDNKFGVESAARMAEEVGVLPLVRYWPSNVTTKKQAKDLFASKIGSVISNLRKALPDSQAHIDALTASINREKAVTMGTNNPPVQNTRAFVMDVNDAIAEGAELTGEKELRA